MTQLRDLFLYLLTPEGSVDRIWKLLVLCFSTACLAYAIRHQIGAPVEVPVASYLALVMLISAPPYILGMAAAKANKNLQNELARMATTDMLTGLWNRQAFFAMAERAGPGTMLMLDLDHFKQVNDTYGHSAGDAVLRRLADQLRATVRDEDILCRLGGEEFAIFLPGLDSREAREIGDRISRGVRVELAGGIEILVTSSVGAAPTSLSRDAGELLIRADEALYAAKRAGRARLLFWAPEHRMSAGL